MCTLATDLPVRLAIIEMEGIHVDTSERAFEELKRVACRYRDNFHSCPIGRVDGVQFARQFFHAIGMDPTKKRPSSEALLNRALKGKEFFHINSLVDVGNWCSLEFLLPICIYDRDKIEGEITVRKGKAHEHYHGLNNLTVHVDERYVFADDTGPFGSPVIDSLRTAVDTSTTKALLGIWAPVELEQKILEENARIFAERTIEICGGSVRRMHVVG
jgi:DNA/RNA-binding domain of Phe-tRNA-synthetase-like protein